MAFLAAGQAIELFNKVLSFIPNPEERQQAQLDFEAALQAQSTQTSIAQMEINKVEAQSKSLFIAGWRPACGWVCVFGLAWMVFLAPALTWICHILGVEGQPPETDTTILIEILFALLGFGTMRSVDKARRISTEVFAPKVPSTPKWWHSKKTRLKIAFFQLLQRYPDWSIGQYSDKLNEFGFPVTSGDIERICLENKINK